MLFPFSWCHYDSLFVFEFCHFNYDVSWGWSLWVPLAWDSLCFLDLGDFFSPQIREIFHHCFFKQVFYPLLFFFSFWYPYYVDIISFHVVLHFPYYLFILSEPLFLFLLFLHVFYTLSSRLLNDPLLHQVCFSFHLLCSSVQKLYSSFPLDPC